MKKILFTLMLLAILVSACAPFGRSEMDTARSRWQSARIPHYRFNLSVGCFCAFRDRMPLTIEVLNGQVVSMTYSDGTPVPAQERETFARYQTIDDLINFVAQSKKEAQDIRITSDPTYGFPADVYIDFQQNVADDELSLTVTNFQALP